MKKSTFTLLLLLLALSCRAQESQTAYNFLRLPVSAHAAALGGDNITLTDDDASLAFHNPALLSSVSDKTIGFNYMNYMSGANMLSASYSLVLADRASLGFGAQYINYGTMRRTDASNVQTGEFSARTLPPPPPLPICLPTAWREASPPAW